MHEATLQYLILASVEGLGCRGVHRLLLLYKEPGTILRSPVAELAAQGVPEVVAKMLLWETRRAQAEAELGNCLQNGVQVLTLADPAYPRLLREIFDPPIVLFCKGDLDCLSSHCISIVGSRRATPYGINVAEKLARELASRGLAVCSGLARGIDTAAHRGAIEAKGKTVAGLGYGGYHNYFPGKNKMALAHESPSRAA